MILDDDSAPQGNGAYLQLLTELREGRLNPGDRLRETELADRLGVSRTPVREAIRQLEADGVVRPTRIGTTANSPSVRCKNGSWVSRLCSSAWAASLTSIS